MQSAVVDQDSEHQIQAAQVHAHKVQCDKSVLLGANQAAIPRLEAGARTARGDDAERGGDRVQDQGSSTSHRHQGFTHSYFWV